MITAIADTHAAIWYVSGDSRLSLKARTLINTTKNNRDQIGVSAITFCEMVYLVEKGRIPPEHFTDLARLVDTQHAIFTQIMVDLPIARAMTGVDVMQIPDFPDRIIAATAVSRGVPVISRDGKIKLSSVPTVW